LGSAPKDAPPSGRTGELPYQTSANTSRIVVTPDSTGEPVIVKAECAIVQASFRHLTADLKYLVA
jgi:hypothetical protein